jgi:hypothetical protein
MIKNCLFLAGLLSLVLAGGCAKGGNGIVPVSPSIDVEITTPTNLAATQIYPTQTVTLTATVSNASTTAVTWSLTGPGTLTPTTPAPTPATAVYVAPATAGSQGTVTATLTADSSIVGSLPFAIADITTQVAPTTLSVATGLTQQFAATASPDDAPQSFTWNCTASGVQCKNFVQDPNVSGLAYYTAQDNCTGNCVQISAAAPLDPTGCTPNAKFCTIGKTSLVASRVNGTYAFRFSGYDGSNNAVAVAGTFTASNGTIASGVEDELILSASSTHSISGGSYTPTSSDPNNSNNAGTLTLALPSGVYPRDFQVVLDGAGDIEMIESDGHGSGSGIAQVSVGASPFKGAQTYAFGFTGVDAVGKRVGYAGLFPMDGSGNIVAGEMDVNDNGSSSDSVCSASPCTVAGSYSGSGSGPYQLTLTAPVAMTFDFYIASGSNSNKSTPLTFFAISTAPGANAAVSGTMVLQDSSQTYNNSAFNGVSVSALTGTATCAAPPCSNVSLTLGSTDGNGNFSGQFDQNNAGAILPLALFPASSQSPSPYTYTAKGPNGTTNGRYIFNMLGDPTAKTPVAPLPFVLYASGANRGFLLDQSSASVMTGTMNPQGKGSGSFSGVSLQGTYAAATTGSGSADVNPIGANLLLTSPGGGVFNISGTEYPGSETVTGTLSYNNSALGSGVAIVTLTAPSAQTQALYPVDTSGCVSSPQNPNPVCQILDFFMIDETSTNKNPSVVFAKQ